MADKDTVKVNGEDKINESLKSEVEKLETPSDKKEEVQSDLENKIIHQIEETPSDKKGEVQSDLENKIIRQIEYYFGDINLGRDKFLQEQIKVNDGWVSLDVLLTFKRLAAMTMDKPTIVAALKKSSSGLIQVSEDESEIRRDPKQPLPEMNEERRQEMMTRTLYFKGFPATTTLNEILEFFNDLAKIENVIMRSYKDKATNTWVFKGSVFVVFPTKGDADQILKKDSIKYEGAELIKLWQNSYLEKRRKERLDERNKKINERNVDCEDEKEEDFVKNAVLHLTGCPPTLTRELIKEKIEEFDVSVAFVDFNRGDTEGWVRMQEEGSALKVLEKVEESKLKIGDDTIDLKALSGEEEINYQNKAKQDIAKRRSQMHRNKKGRRGGRGGNFNRKRRGSPLRDGCTSAKVAATES